MNWRSLLSKILLILVIVGAILPIYRMRVISRQEQSAAIESFYSNFKLEEEPEEAGTLDVAKAELKVLGVLYIPCIDLRVPVYYGTSEAALSEGCGLIEGTGDLSGSKGMNPILTSHNGLSDKNLLMNLNKVKTDDVYYVDNGHEIIQYRVFDIRVVSPIDELKKILHEKDQALSTVRTCTPTGINSHRLLVTGRREAFDGVIQEGTLTFSTFEILLIALAILAFLILLYSIIRDILAAGRRRKEEETETSGE